MAIKPLYEIVNGKILWNPHQFQMRALDSRARFTFMPKGWRGGFSSWAPKLLEFEMRRCGPGHKNLSYFLIAPTLKVATKPGSVQPAVESIFCTYMGYATYNKNEHTFYTTPQGEQALWGHEQKERTPITVCYAEDPDSFASATFLGGIADEVGQSKFRREAWNTLRSRMATTVSMEARYNPKGYEGLKMGRVFAGSTVYTLNWFVDFYEQWQQFMKGAVQRKNEEIEVLASRLARARSDESRRVIQAEISSIEETFTAKAYYGMIHHEMNFIRFDSTANPAFSEEEMENFRLTLPDWFFDMRFRAIPRKPAGMIYEHFEPKVHVVPNRTIPPEWTRGGAIDFGKRNFFACVFAQNPETKEHFMYAAYHRADLSIPEHGAKLAKLFPEVTDWIAGQVSEDDQRAQLATGGLMTGPPPFKSLWLGINNLASGFKLGQMKIFEDLAPEGVENGYNYRENIVDELRTYARPVDQDTGDVKINEDPENKEDYHWCDVIRYYGTRHFAGLAEGIVVAANRKTQEAQEFEIAVRSGKADNSNVKRPLTDAQVLAAGASSGTNKFQQQRYGDVYDPLF